MPSERSRTQTFAGIEGRGGSCYSTHPTPRGLPWSVGESKRFTTLTNNRTTFLVAGGKYA